MGANKTLLNCAYKIEDKKQDSPNKLAMHNNDDSILHDRDQYRLIDKISQ